MGDLKTSIILNLTGNLKDRAQQFMGSLQQLGRYGSASMGILGRGATKAREGIDRLGNRYTALLTGAAGVGALRMFGNLEERFTYLGIEANASAERIDTLRGKITQAAKAAEVRVSPSEITSAIEEIVKETSDLEFAEKNIRNIGIAIRATGAEGESIGRLVAQFQKMDKAMSPETVLKMLDIVAAQKKAGGPFTPKDLAANAPELIASYAMLRKTDPENFIRELGATMQVIMRGAGSSGEAATAFEALIRTLGDLDKVKLLQANGVKIFDEEALKKGQKELLPIPEILEQIIKRSKGDLLKLSDVIDMRAIKAFRSAIGEYKATGEVGSLRHFMEVEADGTEIMRDASRAVGTFNASLTNLNTTWRSFTNRQLAEPVKKLADHLNGLQPGTVERWMNIAKYVAYITGGMVVSSKLGHYGADVYKLGRWILTGGRSGSGGAAGALGSSMTPIPVYVTNWGGTGGSGVPSKGAGNAKAALAATPWLSGAGSAVVPAVAVAAMAELSAMAGKGVSSFWIRRMSSTGLEEMLKRTNVMGGGPESFQARMIQAELDRRLEGEIKIHIESENRASVTGMRSDRGLNLEVDTGRIMNGDLGG